MIERMGNPIVYNLKVDIKYGTIEDNTKFRRVNSGCVADRACARR